MKKSALRKLLDMGLFFTEGIGWKLHPLGTNCVLVSLDNGKAFLTDGERRKEYSSMEAALDTRVTRRKYLLGEE